MSSPITHPGKLGVFTASDGLSASEMVRFAKRIESWGYSTLWLPEAVGRDPFSLIGFLAGQTEKLVLATGIVNIYARDALTTKAAWKTIAEMAPGRFILGLGVSSPRLVEDVRGHEYGPPVPTMRRYLEGLDSALYRGLANFLLVN